MNNWANNLFYIVFLGQIFLTSWLLPRLLIARMEKLLSRYPSEHYPKLYPKPETNYRFGIAVFRWVNHLIFALGFVMLYGAHALDGGSFADDGYISEAWPVVYGVIQFIPLMTLEMLGFRRLKLMRETRNLSTRKASLQPRRLGDSVPLPLLAVAVALLLTVIGVDLYLLDFQLDWRSDAIQRDITLLGTNLAFVAMALWQIYGQRRDPYQSGEDRARQTRVQVSSLMLLSCAVSLYFLTLIAGDRFELHFLDAPLMSLYFQIIVVASIGYVLRSVKLEDMDFEVYRASTERS